MARNEDDWDLESLLTETTLNLESAHPGEPHIQYEAARPTPESVPKERIRRRKSLRLKTYRFQQAPHRCKHPGIIIEEEHHRWLGRHHLSEAPSTGKVI
jgi:hypothetical protein